MWTHRSDPFDTIRALRPACGLDPGALEQGDGPVDRGLYQQLRHGELDVAITRPAEPQRRFKSQ